MFDTELYQQVPGSSDPWKVREVGLDDEAAAIHVSVDHAEGCRWACPR